MGEDALVLTNEERLEVLNLNLSRDLIELRYRMQKVELENKDRELTTRINARLGIDMSKYLINAETGLVTPRT